MTAAAPPPAIADRMPAGSAGAVDATVEGALRDEDTPGASVAIVRDGRPP